MKNETNGRKPRKREPLPKKVHANVTPAMVRDCLRSVRRQEAELIAIRVCLEEYGLEQVYVRGIDAFRRSMKDLDAFIARLWKPIYQEKRKREGASDEEA